ncbi:MAG: 2-oxo acid dehydrogenase subunit E2 [Chitinophagaceae bacterium]|nr:2-oxo acid dehydrogenase subunit E2 [Chitinophagaceae bacterium]
MAIVQEIKVPLIAVNDTSLTVVEMAFEHGSLVKKGDVLMVFETSKTTYDVIAEAAGYIAYSCELDADYEVNEVVAIVYNDAAEVPVKAVPKKETAVAAKKEDYKEAIAYWEGETLFSPAAIELMQANKLDAAVFKGTDFVSKLDVELKLGIAKPALNKKTAANKTVELLPVDPDKVTIAKLSSNKKREIEYLSNIQQTGLTSTINTVVETEGIFVHINPSLQYLKNSLLPVIVYETARLLSTFKELNAYFTGDAVAYYKEVNIGFAIDIDKGLKVLRVKDAAIKSIQEVEAAIMDLSNKYLDDNLLVEDLTGISFTITDLSAENVHFFRPLINMMNSAILGVSSIDEKLNRCILSVSFDHRVTEGKLAAQFLHELKNRLQSYRSVHHTHPNQDISCFKCFKTLMEDLSDVGFTKCITPKGAEAYICQSCLKGF